MIDERKGELFELLSSFVKINTENFRDSGNEEELARKIHKMCEECGILTFYQKCCDLIDVWFGNKEHDNVTLDMEKFVISGGTYGTLSNKLAVERTVSDNSMNYLLKRIFMKKSDLQIIYPQLKQYSALCPYYTVKRWAGLLNKSKQRRIFWELKTNSCITEKEISYASDLMAQLGLDF